MKFSRLRRAALCLTCEDEIAEGELAHTEPRIGSWHADCHPPLNLALYRRERDRDPRRFRQERFDDSRF